MKIYTVETIGILIATAFFVLMSLYLGHNLGYYDHQRDVRNEMKSLLIEMGVANYHSKTGEYTIKNKEEFDYDLFLENYDKTIESFELMIQQ